jgi:hypothetical protein
MSLSVKVFSLTDVCFIAVARTPGGPRIRSVTSRSAPVLDHVQYWTFILAYATALEREDCGLYGLPGGSE